MYTESSLTRSEQDAHLSDRFVLCVLLHAAETPPELGGKLLEESEDGRAERKSGKSPDVVWRTDVTYTMCFYR